MKNRNIRYALNALINHADNAECKDLHHSKKHQHESGFICPVEYHLQHQANVLREYMRENLND